MLELADKKVKIAIITVPDTLKKNKSIYEVFNLKFRRSNLQCLVGNIHWMGINND